MKDRETRGQTDRQTERLVQSKVQQNYGCFLVSKRRSANSKEEVRGGEREIERETNRQTDNRTGRGWCIANFNQKMVSSQWRLGQQQGRGRGGRRQGAGARERE